jgi:hypothetical protein
VDVLSQQLSAEAFADYHQFYLWDSGVTAIAPTEYTDEVVRRRIKTGPNVVVIQPDRNNTVPVEIEIHDSQPPYTADDWDYIAEASLHPPTGQLQVHECTGGVVADVTVEPGWCRVRSFHGRLRAIDHFGEGGDHYLVALWPAPEDNVQIVKQLMASPN